MFKRTARIAQTLLVSVAATTALLATAPTADASGTSAPDLTFCLSYTNNTPYASKPAYLYRWNGTAWSKYRNGSTAANGCGTWRDVAPNSYYYVQGYWSYPLAGHWYAWSGNTPSVWVGALSDGQYLIQRAYTVAFYQLY